MDRINQEISRTKKGSEERQQALERYKEKSQYLSRLKDLRDTKFEASPDFLGKADDPLFLIQQLNKFLRQQMLKHNMEAQDGSPLAFVLKSAAKYLSDRGIG